MKSFSREISDRSESGVRQDAALLQKIAEKTLSFMNIAILRFINCAKATEFVNIFLNGLQKDGESGIITFRESGNFVKYMFGECQVPCKRLKKN